MAPMQKRALIGLGIGIIMIVAILVILIVKGVTTFFDDPGMRIFIDIFFVGGLILYFITVSQPMWRPVDNVFRDERDEQILKSATNTQLITILISLVAWAIALTEVYWDDGEIPIVFPYLILISTIITTIVAQAVGILIGYWRVR